MAVMCRCVLVSVCARIKLSQGSSEAIPMELIATASIDPIQMRSKNENGSVDWINDALGCSYFTSLAIGTR